MVDEDDGDCLAQGFDAEVVPKFNRPYISRYSNRIHLHVRALSWNSSQLFQMETEPDLQPFQWNPGNAKIDYSKPADFQGDPTSMSYGHENENLITKSEPLPRSSIDQSQLRAIEFDESSREPIRNFILPGPERNIIRVLEDVKDRLRPDSTILFLHCRSRLDIFAW